MALPKDQTDYVKFGKIAFNAFEAVIDLQLYNFLHQKRPEPTTKVTLDKLCLKLDVFIYPHALPQIAARIMHDYEAAGWKISYNKKTRVLTFS